MHTYVPAEDAIERATSEQLCGGAGKTRLTVMLLADELSPDSAERQLVDLARGLNGERFRVLITTLSASTFLEDEIRKTPGVEVRSLSWRGRWDTMVVPRLVGMLRREQVDAIQCSAAATTVGLVAAMIARTPLKIVTQRHSARSAGGLGRRFEDRLIRRADSLVIDSELGARRSVARGIPHEKLQVIYDGVPPEGVRTSLAEREALRSELGVLDESWLVGVAGRLTAAAGHGNFLQAASILRAEAPGTKFLVVGYGPLRAELQRRATILGLDGSIIFAGPQVRLAPYIAAMDVAVLPGGDAGASEFGLEAMGLGRPIVAVDAGSNQEFFPMGEVGLIVPPDNPIILAHAILEVMRQPDAVERMRARGRELFNERFTMKRMIASYDELYSDLWRSYYAKRPRGAKAVRSGE